MTPLIMKSKAEEIMGSEMKWLILKRAEITFWEENCAMRWLNP